MAITAEQLQALLVQNQQAVQLMLQQVQAQSSEALQQIMMAMQQNRNQGDNMIDTKGIGKPKEFAGDEESYPIWISKFRAFINAAHPEGLSWLNWAHAQNDIIDASTLELNFPEVAVQQALVRFSNKLHTLLLSFTDKSAWTIIDSVEDGNGLEAYRQLCRRYEPKTPGTKRALLKGIINMPAAKSIKDVEPLLRKVEELMKRYEVMSGTKLPEDLCVTVIIDLCSRELREFLELSTKDMKYQQVKEEIMNYVENKRTSFGNGLKAMEVDALTNDCWGYDEDNDGDYYEISYMPQNSWAGAKAKGKGKGGKGIKASHPFSGKGGYGTFDGMKAGYDRKSGGKATGGKGVSVECHWCHKLGHVQAHCKEKDAYMNAKRAQEGQGKGAWVDDKGDWSIKNLEQSTDEGNHVESGIEALEHLSREACNYRFLGALDKTTIETKNRFSILATEDDSAEQPTTSHIPGDLARGTHRARDKHLESSARGVHDRNHHVQLSSVERGMRVMTLTMDSGAAETVCRPDDAQCYPTMPSEGSQNGVQYVVANGKTMPNRGEKHVRLVTQEGSKCWMKMQVTDVRKPLASVSRICSEGHSVTFTKTGGYITQDETGQVTKFDRRNGVYCLDVWVVPHDADVEGSVFSRQGN